MEKKNLELEVFTADDINCQYIKVYKVLEIYKDGESQCIATYLYKEQAEKEAKQIENDNGIETLVESQIVWLS